MRRILVSLFLVALAGCNMPSCGSSKTTDEAANSTWKCADLISQSAPFTVNDTTYVNVTVSCGDGTAPPRYVTCTMDTRKAVQVSKDRPAVFFPNEKDCPELAVPAYNNVPKGLEAKAEPKPAAPSKTKKTEPKKADPATTPPPPVATSVPPATTAPAANRP